MMAGKLALVTGASRGIGCAIAHHLARRGCRVACIGRDTAAIERVAAALPGTGHQAVTAPSMEGLTKADAEGVVKEVVAAGGTHIDYMVHAAGVAPSGLLLRASEAEIHTTLAVNLVAPLLLTRAGLSAGGMLRSTDGSSVCFLGSVVGTAGNKGQVVYAASKSALTGAARSLAKEYGAKGVRANVVCPGFIDTDMTRALPESQRDAIVAATALGRFGTPEEVAEAVHFTLTSTYLTGHTLTLDGGLAL